MCGRYTVYNLPKHLKRFDIQKDFIDVEINEIENFNAAPGQYLPVVTKASDNENNQINLMKWGLIPRWAKDPKIGYKLINARSETVDEKPSFRKSFENYRCLIPANGYYEWRKKDDEKVPYYFKPLDKETFAFAGLYSLWLDVEGKQFDTFTILTVGAFGAIGEIHNRMPVIIELEDDELWLNPLASEDELKDLIKPYNSDNMDYYAVSSKVGNSKNNYKELIQKISVNPTQEV